MLEPLGWKRNCDCRDDPLNSLEKDALDLPGGLGLCLSTASVDRQCPQKEGKCVIAFIWCKLGLTFGRTEVAVAKVMFIQPKRHHILLLIHNSEERSCHPACKHRCLKPFPPLAWITMLPNGCIQHTFSSVWVYWIALRFSILVQKIWAMKIIGARIYAQIYFHCIISHHSDKENTVNLLSFW